MATGSNSSDGSVLLNTQSGDVVVNGGTFTFDPLVTGQGADVEIFSNGTPTGGYGTMFLVANGGTLYDWTFYAGWYQWTGTTFIPTSGPVPEFSFYPQGRFLDISQDAPVTSLGVTANNPEGIAQPTDTNPNLNSSLSVSVTAVPSPSLGVVFNGGSVVSAGDVLTPAEVASLTFEPMSRATGIGYLSFTVTDGQLAVPEPAVQILVAGTPPAVSASTEVVSNSTAVPVRVPTPADKDYPLTAVSARIIALPSNGTLFADGVPITAAQLPFVLSGGATELTSGLTFELTPGASQASVLWYELTDPSSGSSLNFSEGMVSEVSLVPAVLTTPWALTVPANAGRSAMDIPTPAAISAGMSVSPYVYSASIYYPTSALSASVTELPSDGTVFLSGGGAVTIGQNLTIAQLAGLEFQPTPGVTNETSIFAYTVTDPAGASGVGSATLSVGAPVALWQDPAVSPVGGAGVVVPPATPQPAQLASAGIVASGIVGFDLQNAGNAPEPGGYVTFGQVFRDGDLISSAPVQYLEADVVSGGAVVAADVPVQVNVETTYADGSVKTAILTLSAPPIGAGGTISALLTGTPAAGGAAIGPGQAVAHLLSDGDVVVNIAISGGATYVVSASQLLAAAMTASGAVPQQNIWISGSEVSEYLVSTTVDGGALEVEFDIRAYADGGTTTDVIFSTAATGLVTAFGISAPPAAANIVYSATIAQGGTTVYATPTTSDGTPVYVQQYPYSEWDHTVYSSQTINPNVQYDVPYLEASGAVEAYDTSVGTTTSGAVATLAALNSGNTGNGVINSTGPLGTAGVTVDMEQTGGRSDIGTQPNWTVQWLLAQDPASRQVMLDDAAAGGSVPWNYIDASTGQPINTQTYLNFNNISPGPWNAYPPTYPTRGYPAAGSNPWNISTAHEPDLNYIPALITGSPYQLQLLQNQANFAILDQLYYSDAADTTGTGLTGLSDQGEVRGVAWTLRELAEAAYLTPDTGSVADPTSEAAVKAYFTSELDKTMSSFVQQYITDDVNGRFGALKGFIEGSFGSQQYPLRASVPVYMEDYFATVLGQIAGMNIPGASADAVEMLKYMNNFIAGIYTNGPNGFNPLEGAAYWPYVYDAVTGAPYTTWSQFYNGSFPPNPDILPNGGTVMLGGYLIVAETALADEVTYTELPQAMQAYGFVESEIANAFTTSGGSAGEAAAYQQYPFWNVAPRLPDGQYLEHSQMLIDTSGDSVVYLTGSAGVDMLLSVVGSGKATLVGGSNPGGVDLIYGGSGVNTLVAGKGNDYLFGGVGNTTFVAGTGNDYMQGGASLSAYVGAPNLTSNTYEVTASITSGGRVTTIVDFNPQNDHLVIGARIDGNSVTSAADLFSSGYIQYRSATTASGTTYSAVILLNPTSPGATSATDMIILPGVTSGGLNVNDVQVVSYPPVVSAGSSVLVVSVDDITSAVLSGGTLDVLAGGQTTSVTVSDGGLEIVSGGVANDTTVLNGGSQTVALGQAIGTVMSGGVETVLSGSTSGATVAGGRQIVSGGTTSGTTVLNGDQTVVGGAASNTVVIGGDQTVGAGGTAFATTISNGAVQFVSGGSAIATTVLAGGGEYVSAGGVASGTTVSGGSQNVGPGGVAVSATVLPGANQTVMGGTANNTTVVGGTEVVSAGGLASNTLLLSGGQLLISGGTAVGTIYGSNTSATVGNGGTMSSPVLSGGALTVLNGGTVSDPVIATNGALTLKAGALVGGGITFTGNSGTLTVFGSGGSVLSDHTVISGFAPGDVIDLASIPPATVTNSAVVSGSVLEIVLSGGSTLDIGFDQAPPGGESFVLYGNLLIGLDGVLPNSGLSVSAGTSATIGSDLLQFSDPADTGAGAAAAQTYTVTSLPIDGTLLLNGTPVVSGGTFTQSEVNAGALQYAETAAVSAATIDSFGFTVTDGNTGHTASGTFAINISIQGTADTVTAIDEGVAYNQVVPVASLYTISGPAATQYQLWLNGQAVGSVQDSHGAIATDTAVDETSLTGINYVGGAVAGQDRLWLRTFDGGQWSNWALATLTSPGATPDTVSATPQSAGDQQQIALTSIFSTTGPAPTGYEVWLSGPADGSVTDGNGAIPLNQAVAETSLSGINFVGGVAQGQDRLWLRAFDGQWSDWALATITDLGAVTATDQSVGDQQSVALSSIFTVSGPTPTSYEVWLSGPADGSVTDGNGPIPLNQAVAETSLSGISFVGGFAPGQDRLWVRADYGGGQTSNWALATLTDLGAVSATNQSVGDQQSVALSSIFTVSGPTPTSYEVWLSGPADGSVTDGNGPIPLNQAVAETSLSGINFVGGFAPGQDRLWLQADYGGGLTSNWVLATVTDRGAVSATNQSVGDQQSVALSSIFTVSGPTPTSYEVWLSGPADGSVTDGNGPIPLNQAVAETSLSGINFVGGVTPGQDRLWLRADYGGGQTSNWTLATLTDLGVTPPIVTPTQTAQTAISGQTLAAQNLFTVSNNGAAVTQYGFWDVGTGGGHFTVGGVAQGTSQEIDVAAANLSQVDYIAGTGTDTLWVRADDGVWSNWSSPFTVTG